MASRSFHPAKHTATVKASEKKADPKTMSKPSASSETAIPPTKAPATHKRKALPGHSKSDKRPPLNRGEGIRPAGLIGTWGPR